MFLELLAAIIFYFILVNKCEAYRSDRGVQSKLDVALDFIEMNQSYLPNNSDECSINIHRRPDQQFTPIISLLLKISYFMLKLIIISYSVTLDGKQNISTSKIINMRQTIGKLLAKW